MTRFGHGPPISEARLEGTRVPAAHARPLLARLREPAAPELRLEAELRGTAGWSSNPRLIDGTAYSSRFRLATRLALLKPEGPVSGWLEATGVVDFAAPDTESARGLSSGALAGRLHTRWGPVQLAIGARVDRLSEFRTQTVGETSFGVQSVFTTDAYVAHSVLAGLSWRR